MEEKRKRFLKLFSIALAAAVLTAVLCAVFANWGASYRELPDSTASEWKTPETEEVKAKVDEITERILSGKQYGFEELLYVLDHDSEAGKQVTDYLIEEGKALSEPEAPEIR